MFVTFSDDNRLTCLFAFHLSFSVLSKAMIFEKANSCYDHLNYNFPLGKIELIKQKRKININDSDIHQLDRFL